MRLDLADLKLFLCIVDAGSITQGAQRANLALASASERLRAMEADAGVRLLERQARGIAITEAGAALAHHARLILRQRQALQGELREFATGARGTLCLYVNTAALTEYLPAKLAPWLAQRPHLNVELKERTSQEIVRAISAGQVEAGIISDHQDPGGLVLQPLVTDHLVLLTPARHPLAGQKLLSFAQVLHHPWVGLSPGSALQEHIDAHARAAGSPLTLRIRMPTYEGVCEMVSHGIGLSILPASVARRLRRRYPVHVAKLRERWCQRRLCLCFRPQENLSAPLRELLDYLGAQAAA